jgi:hypothetical protein
MVSDTTPQIVLRPHSLCPLNVGQRYSVTICFPAHPPSVSGIPTHQVPTSKHTATCTTMYSSPPSVPQQSNTPVPSSNLESAFTNLSINIEFIAEPQAVEKKLLSQEPIRGSSPPLPPTSSPSSESSLTLLLAPTSSPSSEPSLVPAASNEPHHHSASRWVVFCGHVPGIYESA